MNSDQARAAYLEALADWQYRSTFSNAIKRDDAKRRWYEAVGREVIESGAQFGADTESGTG